MTEKGRLPNDGRSPDGPQGDDTRPAGLAPDDDELGRVGARYVLLERIGHGGMGTVYAAWDLELTRRVALKLLHRGIDGERFQREAQALARLRHPTVVTVYDVGRDRGRDYITMELIEGESLRTWLDRQPRPWRRVVEIFVAAGRGLAAAHAAGIVHRDFKPDNVLVARDGTVRVVDFGLARNIDEPAGDRPPVPTPEVARGERLTHTGTVLGTPRYMAPEQRLGYHAGPPADQFSFSVSLWEALSGEHPMLGEHHGKPALGRFPARVRAALRRGFADAPAARWPAMDPLLAALDPRRANARRGKIAVAVAVALTGAVALWPKDRSAARACAAADSEALSAWPAAQRAQIRAAFVATGQHGAEAAAEATLETLDRYAAGLAAMTGRACVAARVRQEQSEEVYELRAACLAQHQRGLRALAAELTHADATAVQRATEAARSLPDLAVCADVEALAAPLQVPADRAQRAPVAAVRTFLAEVRAMRLAGRNQPAIVRAQAMVPLARLIGFRPLIAETLLEVGYALSAAELPAEDTLALAAEAAQMAGYDVVLAEAEVTLASAIGREGARTREARRWLGLAEATIARGAAERGMGVRQGELERVRANLASDEKRTIEAERHARLAVRILSERAPESRALYKARAALTSALHSQRKLIAAEVGAREVIAQVLRTGLSPTDLARSRDTLGLVLMDQGRYAEALEESRQAVQLVRAAVGPDSRFESVMENNHALILIRSGRRADALPVLERAVAMGEKVGPPGSQKMATSLSNLGQLYQELGRYDEARVALERARDMVIAEKGEADFRLIYVHSNLAGVAARQGRRAEARALAKRALALAETRGIHDAMWVDALIAEATAHDDDPAAALPLFRRALAAAEQVYGPDSPDGRALQAGIARASRRQP